MRGWLPAAGWAVQRVRDGMRRTADSRKNRLRFILALVVTALVLTALYQGGRWLEKRNQKPEARGDYRQRYDYEKLFEYDGASYRLRKNLTTLLVMGIDRPSGEEAAGYRNGGQADFLRLVVIDHGNKRVTQLAIDRDTMTPITILGVMGNRSRVRTAQISLSHGFGDGRAESCELTSEAVSNLLFDTPIDFYVAMNLDGISALNDLVGGVTVTLADDFSALDPTMTPGTTLTLHGEQAEYYVRTRRSIGIGTNEARMARQEEYLSQLFALLDERQRDDKDFIGTLYDALSAYLVTDLSRGQMINEAWSARAYDRDTLVRLEGTHRVGSDGFMQFYADEASLQKTVVELFYEKME